MKSKVYSNLDTKGRVAGVLDYKSLAIFLSILFTICSISSLLNLGFKVMFILICIYLPFGLVLLFCNTKNEDSVSVIKNILRYYLTKKIYLVDYTEIKKSSSKFGKIYAKDVKLISKKCKRNINKSIFTKSYLNSVIKKIKNRTNE